MRIRKLGRMLAVLLAFALIAAACGDDDADAPTGDVTVCELAYYTGEFAAYGAFLTAGVVFPVDEII